MAIIQLTMNDGQKPTQSQLLEIKAAAKQIPIFDPECRPSGLTALADFAAKARALRGAMRTAKPAATIRLTSRMP